MKQILKVITVFSFLISTLIIYINPEVNASEKDQWHKIKERGELRVGLSADYAPYEFEHNVNGKSKYTGIAIDIAKKIAIDKHLTLKIVHMQCDSLLGAIQTGKIDIIISGMSPTPERLSEVHFSKRYMTADQKLIIKKSEEDRFKT